MAKDLLLVELYAGLASLSLWFFGAKPPLGRRGSKTAYAERIAGVLFGDRKPTRFLLNDADECIANVLRCLCDPRLRVEVARHIETSAQIKKQAYLLWHDLNQNRDPNDPLREAARWLMLSAGCHQGMMKHGCEMRPDLINPPGNHPRVRNFSPRLDDLTNRIRAFPLDVSFCDVRHGPAETLDPISGAVAYLDPPYVDTNGYLSITLLPPRSIAERWARADCRIGLSETLASQAPLGWACIDLIDPRGSGKRRQMIRAGRRELLFVSP